MTAIEWTDETWNPVVGCTNVSEGCRFCYARRMSARLAANPKTPQYDGVAEFTDDGARWTGVVKCLKEKLEKPMHWSKPRRVFVNSMSDLFHESVPFEFVAAVYGVMGASDDHDFQVLTKRPERALDFYRWVKNEPAGDSFACAWWANHIGVKGAKGRFGRCYDNFEWPPTNVWLGTSVENEQAANERIPQLMQCPASIRFLSCEPLLGEVDLSAIEYRGDTDYILNVLHGTYAESSAGRGTPLEFGMCSLNKIDWVIAGGESGPNARPAHPDWFRSLRDQCESAGVPFLFKQWGAWRPRGMNEDYSLEQADHCVEPDGTIRELPHGSPGACLMIRERKSDAGRTLDGETHDAFPEVSK